MNKSLALLVALSLTLCAITAEQIVISDKSFEELAQEYEELLRNIDGAFEDLDRKIAGDVEQFGEAVHEIVESVQRQIEGRHNALASVNANPEFLSLQTTDPAADADATTEGGADTGATDPAADDPSISEGATDPAGDDGKEIQGGSSSNTLYIVFAILGVLLLGVGAFVIVRKCVKSDSPSGAAEERLIQ